jgi:A/G-specific adenine glycosylase
MESTTFNFSNNLLTWYNKNQRDLPWRKNNPPYEIVVSEIMLQQTNVPKVIEKFKEFLRLFPTIKSLAAAEKSQVIQSWSGLGYNRRALMLHKFAQEIVINYNSIVPSTAEELIKLPGIGPYTAGAIASFAFNKPEPAVDVNLRRTYMRYFHGQDQALPMGKKEEVELFSLIKSSIPENKSSLLHNALMDFGSLICKAKNPSCESCFQNKDCKFAPKYKSHGQQALFVKEKKQEQGIEENGKHVPNRIFRGRIVEWVRNNQGTIELKELGRRIKKDFTDEEGWLLKLISALEKDGFITKEIQGDQITLHLSN